MRDDDVDEGVDLSYYWQVVKKRRAPIGCVVAIATAITVVVSLCLPRFYTAKANIMAISNNSGGGGGGLAAMAAQMGGMGSLIGLGSGPSIVQQFMALLSTRTLAERVITDNNLLPILFPKEPDRPLQVNEKAVKALKGCMKFTEDKKGGIIVISAEARDPQLAADIANEYVTGLRSFVNDNSFTLSKRNRIFLGKQLEENKRELLEGGKELSEFYLGNKISNVGSHLNVPIKKRENFKSHSSYSERDLGKGSNSSEKLRVGLENLQSQGVEPESMSQPSPVNQRGNGNSTLNPDGLTDDDSNMNDQNLVKNVPQQTYLQYLLLHRTQLIQVNTLLVQQYEMAKINEMKDDLVFQVIDPARAPEQRSSPRRTLMVLIAFWGSLLLSVLGVILLDYMKQPKEGHNGKRN